MPTTATPAERTLDADHAGDRVQAHLVNLPLARLATELAPPYYEPWATDEPFPREAFLAMWAESQKHVRRGVVWDLDPDTRPLFEEWIEAIGQHIADAPHGGPEPA